MFASSVHGQSELVLSMRMLTHDLVSFKLVQNKDTVKAKLALV